MRNCHQGSLTGNVRSRQCPCPSLLLTLGTQLITKSLGQAPKKYKKKRQYGVGSVSLFGQRPATVGVVTWRCVVVWPVRTSRVGNCSVAARRRWAGCVRQSAAAGRQLGEPVLERGRPSCVQRGRRLTGCALCTVQCPPGSLSGSLHSGDFFFNLA